MLFDRDTYKRFFHGFDIIDCTIGFGEGRLGFLLAEIKEGKAHDDPCRLRVLAVKRMNPLDTRYFFCPPMHWTSGPISPAPGRRTMRSLSVSASAGRSMATSTKAQGPVGPHFLPWCAGRCRAALRQHRAADGACGHHLVCRGLAGQWRRLAFPSDLSLRTVAVAPNGTAYITDENGRVWKGRDDDGRCVTPVWKDPYGFKDSAWFAGRLWCTGDKGGLYVLQGRRMVLAQDAREQPMPWEFSSAAQRLDVPPDGRMLLIAGGVWAAQFDGEQWSWLINGMPSAQAVAEVPLGW